MRRAGVVVGAKGFHQVGVAGDIVEPIERRRAAFIIAVIDEMLSAGLFVRAERFDQVSIAGDIIEAVKIVVRPSLAPCSI